MENTVNCPYLEPNCSPDAALAGSACGVCGRYAKKCLQCSTRNRALANFCRGCGTALEASPGNWPGYKGGPQRLGVNTALPPARAAAKFDFTATGDLQLGDPCRSLLGLDGQLIAIAQNGAVAVADPSHIGAAQRFQATAPTCEPCIDRGVLYIGSRGQLTAYSLGSTTMAAPHLRPLWHLALSGTPIQALAAAAERLYVTVTSGGAKQVQVVERIHEQTPTAPRTLYAGANVSWLAADASSGRAVFFSDDGGGMMLHAIEGTVAESRAVALTQLSDHPIALAGDSILGIFGDQQRLHRVDATTGEVLETLDADTQSFSIRYGRDTEWERDAVRLDSDGIVFSRSGPRDAFSQHDRAVRGSPLVVRGRAAVVAMRDRILVYDLLHPPTHHVWRLKTRGGIDASITALASFGHFIAAGNDQGTVEVVALSAPAGGATP